MNKTQTMGKPKPQAMRWIAIAITSFVLLPSIVLAAPQVGNPGNQADIATTTQSQDTATSVVQPLEYSPAAWSPYVAGGLIGVLSLFTFYYSNKPLGASTSYAMVAGKIGEAVAPKRTGQLKFFADKKPKLDWQVMLVLGVIAGAFISAFTGGELTGQLLPQMWSDRFGADSVLLRSFAVLVGGGLMAIGARMAGGCTSGHGISGTLQLSIGSWVTVIFMFIGGILVSFAIFVWTV